MKFIILTPDEGYVKNTEPPAGTQIVEGSQKIKVYVSTGSENKQIAVPSIIDKNIEAAKAEITAVGLTVGEITARDDSNKEKDIVIETNPLPGIRVAKGSSVSIVISSGKKS